MKGLTYGVAPEPWRPPDEGNHLLVGLSKVPMRLEERDLTGMLTHTFPLEQWREAFTVLATQGESGAVKVAFDFR